jgi:hypothetical protein
MMKKKVFVTLQVLVLAVAGSQFGCVVEPGGGAEDLGEAELAANTPGVKSATALSTVTLCGSGGTACLTGSQAPNGVWQDVMSSTIKTASITDLLVDVSLVTGIYTSTTVKGGTATSPSQAVAMGGVKVRVLLDGQPGSTYPDKGEGITFDQRVQTMSGSLGNVFTACFARGGNTSTGCTLTEQELTLALETTSAQSYGFILPNVGVGTHTVTVQAQVNAQASDSSVAISNAMYGMGTMTVDAARFVNSFTL